MFVICNLQYSVHVQCVYTVSCFLFLRVVLSKVLFYSIPAVVICHTCIIIFNLNLCCVLFLCPFLVLCVCLLPSIVLWHMSVFRLYLCICWKLLSSVLLALACNVVMNSICCHFQTFFMRVVCHCWNDPCPGCLVCHIVYSLWTWLYLLHRNQHILAIHPAASMLASALLHSIHGLCNRFSPSPLLVCLQRWLKEFSLVSILRSMVKKRDFTLLNSIWVLNAYQWCTELQPKSDKFRDSFPINGEQERT